MRQRIAHMDPKTLGHLYTDVAALLSSESSTGLLRRELDRLCERYGADNVMWILGVVADDLADAADRAQS